MYCGVLVIVCSSIETHEFFDAFAFRCRCNLTFPSSVIKCKVGDIPNPSSVYNGIKEWRYSSTHL